MSAEALKEWTKWLAAWVAVGYAVSAGVSLLPFGRDDTDGAWPARSDMRVLIDAKTGCQYLSRGDGLTPRLDATGRQLGCRYEHTAVVKGMKQ